MGPQKKRCSGWAEKQASRSTRLMTRHPATEQNVLEVAVRYRTALCYETPMTTAGEDEAAERTPCQERRPKLHPMVPLARLLQILDETPNVNVSVSWCRRRRDAEVRRA